jgi:predicted RNA-binding Zn-ribbon protein involved in translation (DUF1610 family)
MDKNRLFTLIRLEDIADDRLRGLMKRSAALTRLMGYVVVVFAVSILLGAFLISSRGRVEFLPARIVLVVTAVSLIVYLILQTMQSGIGKNRWRCPDCGGELPYYQGNGRVVSIRGMSAYEKVRDQEIPMGSVDSSRLTVPAVCPHCGKRLIKKEILD